jgi:hypothetical protein
MLIYNYDQFTNEYIGSSEAYLDVEETKIQGKEVYSLPAYATFDKPPKAKANEIIIYDNGWQIVADYRGKYIVNDDMQPFIYDKTGNLPEGYIAITDNQAQKIQEDDLYYVISDGKLVKNPDYAEQKAARERQRLDSLFLTPADVERALYAAKGMDFDDLKALIAQQAPQLDMKALAIEFRANNFYRGALVGNIRLIDTVGALLGYTTQDMDYLFENKELPKEE